MPRRGYKNSAAVGSKRRPICRQVSSPRQKFSGLDQRGGVRSGAGEKPSLNWDKVRKTAEAGVPYEDIAAAMVSPELLENPVLRERLKAEVEAGNTRHRIDLRMAVRKKGIVRGSVTALSLAARNTPLIDWDQNVVPHQAAPDLTGVAERLATIIEKLAAKMRPS